MFGCKLATVEKKKKSQVLTKEQVAPGVFFVDSL